MKKESIQPGDKVTVNMHAVAMTIATGTVLKVPYSPGEPWVIKDDLENIHYIYERVTVSYVAPS